MLFEGPGPKRDTVVEALSRDGASTCWLGFKYVRGLSSGSQPIGVVHSNVGQLILGWGGMRVMGGGRGRRNKLWNLGRVLHRRKDTAYAGVGTHLETVKDWANKTFPGGRIPENSEIAPAFLQAIRELQGLHAPSARTNDALLQQCQVVLLTR